MKFNAWLHPWFLIVGGLGLAGPGHSAESEVVVTYSINHFKTARSLGLDIYKCLRPKQRDFLNAEPVSLETDMTPALKLATLTNDQHKVGGFVFVTVGLMDVVENVSHAKAIDNIEKGYFEKYVLSLGTETGENSLKPLPGRDNPKFWTPTLKNEHLSSMHQMMGTAVAIKLAHFYLGHYQKYGSQLEDAQGNYTTINKFLTQAEWEDAMKAGVRAALESGLGIEGIKALFEAIDKMPQRPPWTVAFLPANIKYKAVKKELEKIEKAVLTGQ